MTPRVDQMKSGTCGCGRSPTGDCCGWHRLTEQQYVVEHAQWQARKAAEENTKSPSVLAKATVTGSGT